MVRGVFSVIPAHAGIQDLPPARRGVVQESPAGTPALLPAQVRGDHAVGVTIPANRTKIFAISMVVV
jgi:hypothetical protein